MNEEILNNKITKFWEWFQANESNYRDVEDPQKAVEEMDEHVLEFGLFSWEIGESTSRPYYFMISPNGDGDRLNISYKIMEAAPNMWDWEFRFCKPPQDWNYAFETYDKFLVKKEIDAAEWDYILDKTPDGFFEIIICAANMWNIDTEDQLNAAEMVLTKILGEELVIEYLGALEVVTEFSAEQESRSKKLPVLKKLNFG